MFRKKSQPQVAAVPDNITRRVSRLSTGVLGEYVETSVSDAGRYARLYTSTDQDAYLDEAILNAQVVLALLTEMKNRGTG
jgi:hypothetical protein